MKKFTVVKWFKLIHFFHLKTLQILEIIVREIRGTIIAVDENGNQYKYRLAKNQRASPKRKSFNRKPNKSKKLSNPLKLAASVKPCKVILQRLSNEEIAAMSADKKSRAMEKTTVHKFNDDAMLVLPWNCLDDNSLNPRHNSSFLARFNQRMKSLMNTAIVMAIALAIALVVGEIFCQK